MDQNWKEGDLVLCTPTKKAFTKTFEISPITNKRNEYQYFSSRMIFDSSEIESDKNQNSLKEVTFRPYYLKEIIFLGTGEPPIINHIGPFKNMEESIQMINFMFEQLKSQALKIIDNAKKEGKPFISFQKKLNHQTRSYIFCWKTKGQKKSSIVTHIYKY